MTLPDHLSTLESAGLIRLAQLDPDLEYLFRHALVQDAAYASLLTADQKQLHLAVGTAVERLYPDQLEENAAMLARHFKLAGEDQKALNYFILAGEAALASYANQEAESLYRSALTLSCCEPEQTTLLDGLGEALYRQSRFAEAILVWRESIDLYQSLGDSNGVAQLYARSAQAAWHYDIPECLRLSREGVAAVAGAPDSPEMALLKHEAARACFFNGLPDEALPLCRQALEIAERLGAVDVQADALATLGILPDQSPEVVFEALLKSVELSETHGLLQTAGRAHHNLGVMESDLKGDLQAARDHYLRSAEVARQRGVVAEDLFALVNATEVSLDLGDLSAAEKILRELDQQLKDIADPAPFELSVNAIRARLLWIRGQGDRALQLAHICQTEARQRGNLQRLSGINNDLISVLLELHRWGELEDLQEVEDLLTEVIEIFERGLGGTVWPYCRMSVLRARQGKLQDSHRWLAKAREAAGSQPSLWNYITLGVAEAGLATAERHWPEALAAAESVAGIFARMGARWYWAIALQNWAEIHILRGEPADLPRAQALFREALAMFDEMGAPWHRALVEDRLQALREDLYAQALAYQKDARELAQAGIIQASFLPQEMPHIPGWQLAASLTPARETSGDFYDFIPLPDGRLGIVIADVADKGAAAALYMTSGRTLIHAFALEQPDSPEFVIGEANRRITRDTHEGLFITLFYGVLDPASGMLVYCNAGHNPPFLLQARGGFEVQTLTRTGIPLGIVEETTWEQRALQLSPGDMVLFYTDGVTEAQNSQKLFFEEERLLASAQSNSGRTAQQIHDAVQKDIQEFVSSAPQFDDITLVVLVRDSA